jgi:hypothetical protein
MELYFQCDKLYTYKEGTKIAASFNAAAREVAGDNALGFVGTIGTRKIDLQTERIDFHHLVEARWIDGKNCNSDIKNAFNDVFGITKSDQMICIPMTTEEHIRSPKKLNDKLGINLPDEESSLTQELKGYLGRYEATNGPFDGSASHGLASLFEANREFYREKWAPIEAVTTDGVQISDPNANRLKMVDEWFAVCLTKIEEWYENLTSGSGVFDGDSRTCHSIALKEDIHDPATQSQVVIVYRSLEHQIRSALIRCGPFRRVSEKFGIIRSCLLSGFAGSWWGR